MIKGNDLLVDLAINAGLIHEVKQPCGRRAVSA